MFGLVDAYLYLTAHPIVGLIVLACVTGGTIAVLSGGNLGGALGSMFRVFLTFFTTPFVFLKDAMGIIRGSAEAEEDYKQSRVFMLFRGSRLQYLGLLVLCILVLSSGITSSLLTLYPSAEIAQSRALADEYANRQLALEAAQEAATAAASPDYRQQLETARDEARNAYQQQLRSNAAFIQGTTFSGGVISQIAGAGSADTVRRLRENMDYYMANCPRGYNWRGMTVESCGQFRAFAMELAGRRLTEFDLALAATQADQDWREADAAAQRAAEALAEAQAQLDYAREQREAFNPWNPERIADRLGQAAASLLLTFWSVIITVWLGATAISLLSWLILMMRTLEKLATEKLERSRGGGFAPIGDDDASRR